MIIKTTTKTIKKIAMWYLVGGSKELIYIHVQYLNTHLLLLLFFNLPIVVLWICKNKNFFYLLLLLLVAHWSVCSDRPTQGIDRCISSHFFFNWYVEKKSSSCWMRDIERSRSNDDDDDESNDNKIATVTTTNSQY